MGNPVGGINNIQQSPGAVATTPITVPKSTGKISIADKPLSFSKHLNQRIERRRLELSPERIDRLKHAVDRAAGKGSRDSVVFLDNLALLVNVTNRTVLTAIETEKMKEGVFTNIDSVVVG